MPRPLAGCSEILNRFNETLQHFRIYALSYETLQRFIEALSNLTRPRSGIRGYVLLLCMQSMILLWQICPSVCPSRSGIVSK